MPFAMNAATQYINPTKGLEYMATGRPIVGTPVRDVVRQWSDVVWVARDANEFVAAVEEALAGGFNHPRVLRGLELARQCVLGINRGQDAIVDSNRDGKSNPPIGGEGCGRWATKNSSIGTGPRRARDFLKHHLRGK